MHTKVDLQIAQRVRRVHVHALRALVVLAIVKIGQGEADSNFDYCVYNYTLIG